MRSACGCLSTFRDAALAVHMPQLANPLYGALCAPRESPSREGINNVHVPPCLCSHALQEAVEILAELWESEEPF